MPTVAFVFSRKKCNTYAQIVSRMNLISNNESAKIRQIFQQAVKRLNGNDKNLPQVLIYIDFLLL